MDQLSVAGGMGLTAVYSVQLPHAGQNRAWGPENGCSHHRSGQPTPSSRAFRRGHRGPLPIGPRREGRGAAALSGREKTVGEGPVLPTRALLFRRWSPGRTGGSRRLQRGGRIDPHREEVDPACLVGDVDTVDDEEGAHHDRPEPVTDRLPQQQGKQGSAGLRSERSRWCNRPSSSAEASVHRGRYQSISGSVFRRRIRVSQLPQKTAGVRSTVSPHGQRRWSGSPWMRSKSCASLLEEPQPSQRHAQTTRSTSTVTSPRSAFSGSRIRRGTPFRPMNAR